MSEIKRVIPGNFKRQYFESANPRLLKPLAIRILNDKSSTPDLIVWALNVVQKYKALVTSEFQSLPNQFDEHAICIDHNGKRVDLRAR